MSLAKLSAKNIAKNIEDENFKYKSVKGAVTESKKERLWSYETSEGKVGYVNVVKTKEGFHIDAIQDFQDKEFSKKLNETLKLVEEKLQKINKNAIIENAFIPQETPNKEGIENYLNELRINNIYDKFTTKGTEKINFLLELKEKGYIKKLYSSGRNEVVVEFEKTEAVSKNFINKMSEMGMTLKEYEATPSSIDIKDFFKIAQMEQKGGIKN